ncbi:outer membrane lipoprotein-sorting protein [Vibrio vulnificus]|uniref:outer membrane lipoprotein-sorting protein n=1 Tax=Vibrio vulnificus TaxID=672 RepID=UPI000CD23D17|nr:outer membrane lipoprotein-sorting protein [Vibrio vulnificus]EHH0802403.1 outer membrane lipoprotein-sorting protein [Vibrio vulnificus]POC17658.1 outer membrane lipoprotein-sorting protein [Vibrio vulnificus]
MYNAINAGLWMALLCASNWASAQPSDEQVVSMIKQADDYRLKETSARVVSLVSLYENDQLDKTREYHVYTRPNRESLVIFKSAVEAGQKMLMLQDNYWLQMPKSRRPIRITPMQKLLGEASVGDISTLTWSEDYQAIWRAEESVSSLSGQATPTQHLQLTAKTSGASYQTIDLWLTVPEHFPLKADLYLRSGKLAKQAWFTRGGRNGELSVTEMTLLDHIQPAKKTVIEYQDVQPWQLEDKFYNPSYLSKADSVQF